MKSGNLETTSADELFSLDEGAPSVPAESAAYDQEFRVQFEKTERLNQYYDEVVAELRALFDQSADEAR